MCKYFNELHRIVFGGALGLWLECLSLDQVVQARALAGDIALCSWARHFNSHSTSLHLGVQMGTSKFNAGGNPVMD